MPPTTWLAALLLLLALGALLELPWVRARVARRARARLAALFALARDRHALAPLVPLLRELEEAGAALVVGAAVSGLLYVVLGLAVQSPGADPGVRTLVSLPFALGSIVMAAVLLRLLLLAPRAVLLWLLRGALEGVEAVARPLGRGGVSERRPFLVGALLAAGVLLGAGVAVAG